MGDESPDRRIAFILPIDNRKVGFYVFIREWYVAHTRQAKTLHALWNQRDAKANGNHAGNRGEVPAVRIDSRLEAGLAAGIERIGVESDLGRLAWSDEHVIA